MSEKLIPEHIDPFRFAEQGITIAGVVNVVDMRRLADLLWSTEGRVKVDFHFKLDAQRIPILTGSVQTSLVLQCQRCMEPFTYEIMSSFCLGIVRTLKEADSLPKAYEPALVLANVLALRELVEDEIILNLPIIPKHAVGECSVLLPLQERK